MIVDDSALIHEKPYDPQKAREYYLRTRKLKGRKARSGDPEPGAKRSGSAKPQGGNRPAKVVKTKAQKRKEAEVQVAALKKRLERLKDVLAELVKAAKARSGVETKTDKAKAKAEKNADAKSRTPLTAKQKREAAKRAKEHYEENKKNPEKDVEELQKQIKEIRAKIKAAIADAKKKSASKGRDK